MDGSVSRSSDLEAPLRHHEQADSDDADGACQANGGTSSGEPDDGSNGGQSWHGLAWILLGDMFGVSVFALPGVYARLGWALGLAATIVICLSVIYSGVLFTLLTRKVPHARGLEDYGTAAYGRRGLWLVRCTVSLGILLTPAFFHLTAAQALQALLWRWHLSFLTCTIIVAAVLAPLAQIQDIADAGWIGVVSTSSMALAVVIVVVRLAMRQSAATGHQLINTGDPRMALVALLDLVFAYGGQQNWARFMTGLRNRSQFHYSVALASTFMTGAFVLVGGVGYWKLGSDFDMDQPVTSSLSKDAWSMPMNAAVFLHCALGYQLNLNTWADLVLRTIKPKQDHQGPHGQHAWQAWSIATVAGILFAGFIAWAVPLFSSLMALISAFADLQAAYSLPAAFTLKLFGNRLPRWQRVLNHVLIVVGAVLFVLGSYSSIYTIYSSYATKA